MEPEGLVVVQVVGGEAGEVVEDGLSVVGDFDDEGDSFGADVEGEIEERAACLLGLGEPEERSDAGRVVAQGQAELPGFEDARRRSTSGVRVRRHSSRRASACWSSRVQAIGMTRRLGFGSATGSGWRCSRSSTSRQMPSSWPRRSRRPTVRKPQARWRAMLAVFSGKMPV